MTGRTPYRVGIHNWIPMFSPMHVRSSEITIATLLKDNGYATCHSGKWHLNGRFNLDGQPQPSDHGFDHWFSTQNNALPNHHDPDNFVRNGKAVGKLKGYSSHLVTDEAIHWLKDVRDKSKPFFLYVCFHEPHEPIASAQRYTRYVSLSGRSGPGRTSRQRDPNGRRVRPADGVRWTCKVCADDTMVIFTSDNGPAITSAHPNGSAGPLREKKGHVYDGGIRVPGIIRWPGHSEAGTVCDTPICGVDLLPTLCEITGTAVPADRAIDGTSMRSHS